MLRLTMKANSPTHEEITQRAQKIWHARGCPEGCDLEIWLEAEQESAFAAVAHNTPADAPARGEVNSPADAATTAAATPDPEPGGPAEKIARQKKAARAPKLPGKSAPKAAPPETGKPLWSKPHSS